MDVEIVRVEFSAAGVFFSPDQVAIVFGVGRVTDGFQKFLIPSHTAYIFRRPVARAIQA